MQTHVNPSEVGIYLKNLDENSFNIDLWSISHDFFNRFPYHGYLETPDIQINDVSDFFDDHQNEFTQLTNEYLKKISQFEKLRT